MTAPAPASGAAAETALTRRLRRFSDLSTAEVEVLRQLDATGRPVRHGREIITQGRRYDGLFTINEGIALRYRILHDGRRQVLNIALPGDFVGYPACFFESALYSVSALTDALVTPIPFDALIGLLERTRGWPRRSSGRSRPRLRSTPSI